MAHALKATHDISLAAPFVQLFATLQGWRQRASERAQLASFTARELQDIGLTCADKSYLLDKPVWRG